MKNRLNSRSLLTIAALSIPLGVIAAPIAQAAPYQGNRWNQTHQPDTLSGRVERVISSREFDLSDSGHTYRVTSDSYLNIERGDQVSVRGDLRGSNFHADTVNMLNRNNNNRNDRWDNDRPYGTSFDGLILNREGDRELRVRSNDGRVYTVRTNDDLSSRFTKGDSVHVDGTFTNTLVRNAHVYEIRDNGRGNGTWNGGGGWGRGNGNGGWNNGGRDNGNSNNWNTNDRVEFNGVLLTIRADRNRAWVKGPDGKTHEIHLVGNRIDDFREGQSVHIRAVVRSDYLDVTSISR